MLPRAVRRLDNCSYLGPRLYFFTSLTRQRARFFVDAAIVDLCRAQFLRAAGRTHFEISACCYMPDHVHLLVEGLRADADFLQFAKLAKQLAGYHVKQQHRIELWARGYHDRVVREDEDRRRYVRYIRDNPVKGRLVANPEDYPFLYIDTAS
jgi:putative transposase